jgi:hypothetical protein
MARLLVALRVVVRPAAEAAVAQKAVAGEGAVAARLRRLPDRCRELRTAILTSAAFGASRSAPEPQESKALIRTHLHPLPVAVELPVVGLPVVVAELAVAALPVVALLVAVDLVAQLPVAVAGLAAVAVLLAALPAAQRLAAQPREVVAARAVAAGILLSIRPMAASHINPRLEPSRRTSL